jgi:hypothetical protein
MAFWFFGVVWVINLLPMGYLVLGTMSGYGFVSVLFVSFSAPRDKLAKTNLVLLSNIILFYIFIYIVRWI